MSIDVGESLEQIIILCRRLASLRKIQLDGSPPAQTIKLEGSIFNLQHILFRCVEIALISTAQNSTVHIAVESTDNGARIVVTGGDPVQEVPNIADKASFLAQLVERIGGQLDNSLGTGQPVKLTVILPRCLESISNGPDGESI